MKGSHKKKASKERPMLVTEAMVKRRRELGDKFMSGELSVNLPLFEELCRDRKL